MAKEKALRDRTDTACSAYDKAQLMAQAGQWAQVMGIVGALPDHVFKARPELRLIRADAALRLGNSHEAVQDANALLSDGAHVALEVRARAYLVRSAASRVREFVDAAVEDARAAIALLGADSEYPGLRAEGYRHLGIALGMRGELDEAIQTLEEGLKLCSRVSDLRLQAGLHHSLGIALARLGQYVEARVHFNNAKAAYRKLNMGTELSDVLNNLGRLHYDLGEYGDSLETLREGLRVAEGMGYGRTQAMLLANIGDTQQEMGRHEDALESYRRAIKLAENVLEPRLLCCINTGMGRAHRALGNGREARACLRSALYEASRLGLKHETAIATLNLGILEHIEGDEQQATESLRNAVALLEGMEAKGDLVTAYLYLAMVYLRRERWALLNRVLKTLCNLAGQLDFKGRLLLEAKAVRPVVEYAASKRIGGALFKEVLESLQRGEASTAPAVVANAVHTVKAEEYPVVRVYSLGQARVVIGEHDVGDSEWESQKARELFYYLMSHKAGSTREKLVEVLWPEMSSTLCRNAFYSNVHRIRRAVYRDCIGQRDGTYRINEQGRFWFDLDEFTRLVRQAESLPRGGEERADRLRKAVELYRGGFLEDFYAEWCDTLRMEAEAEYLRSLASLAGYLAARGSYDQAAELLNKLLAVDNTDERAHEELIKLLMRRGEVSAAHQRYRLYRELVIKEHGVEPSRSFEELCRDAGVAQ
jgi:two-component SAPR family response regulator